MACGEAGIRKMASSHHGYSVDDLWMTSTSLFVPIGKTYFRGIWGSLGDDVLCAGTVVLNPTLAVYGWTLAECC